MDVIPDPRFAAMREALAAYASDPDDPAPVPGEALQAAVALVVRADARMDVLLIKRARREGDPWSGHMALPGGRRDAADRSLLDTAVRETLEEIGVDLARTGVHLGRLETVAPQSVRLPRLSVTPHVFGVPAGTIAHAASAEVETVHWVGIDQLRDPATHAQVRIPLPNGTSLFPSLRVAEDVVWGLTYRILQDFLARAQQVFPLPRAE